MIMSVNSMSFMDFTEKNPCRCGFDGKGIHFCHAGRAIGDRCTREAKPRFVATVGSLAGMQMKTSAEIACYCDECHAEAFPQ